MNDNQNPDGSELFKGNNRLIIICGAALGLATAVAAKKGILTPDGALPAFAVILFGLLVCELVAGLLKGASPMHLFTTPARILAMIAGVGVDMVGRALLGA